MDTRRGCTRSTTSGSSPKRLRNREADRGQRLKTALCPKAIAERPGTPALENPNVSVRPTTGAAVGSALEPPGHRSVGGSHDGGRTVPPDFDVQVQPVGIRLRGTAKTLLE